MPSGSAKPPTRRTLLAAGLTTGAMLGARPLASFAQSSSAHALRILDDKPGHPISPLIYGSNEIGAMDGGPLSATLDRIAGVTFRRLGGNLMTAYNWVNNATNAGKDHRHANGAFLLEALRIPKSMWNRPAVVIEAMHEASLAMGAKSLVAVPISGFVAADFAGPVLEAETAPSPRFVEARWTPGSGAKDPVDPRIADMPQLLSRLVERYGGAGSARGISAYTLDNEPGIWFQNHPRLSRTRATIRGFIARSIAVARMIKSIDPDAKIFGPASWGATEMVSFQSAPDWNDFQRSGSFLAAYLDAFRQASEQDGKRLLDVLDVHWYPFSQKGSLFRSENPELDQVRLDAPRSLMDPGFQEDSWVPRAFRGGGEDGLSLPILPSLNRLIARRFPGTGLAVTEFNYGGAGRITSALALADALGAFGIAGVQYATHWGSLAQWLAEAYRLYRTPDATGAVFGDRTLAIEHQGTPAITAYAADDARTLNLIVINKGDRTASVDIAFANPRPRRLAGVLGFDSVNPKIVSLPELATPVEGSAGRITLPPRAARRYSFV